MHGTVALSVILTTHTGRSHFEALLLTLTRINHPGIELIVINDAADLDLAESIQRILKNSDSDHIYYFEHELPAGRGSCLNEGLVQASGTLVWAPLRADRLNESLLTDAIRRFKSDPAAFWSLDFSLPDEPELWIEAAADAALPDDTCLVWNRTVISAHKLFFNPYMNELHGAELALRLMNGNTWHKTDPFFVLSENQSIFAQTGDIREFIYSALRRDIDPEVRSSLLNKLSTLNYSAPSLSQDEQLLLDARQYLNTGDANKSLELINRFIRKYPGHLEANRIKITSLEKLRRHVEAAELKHRLQKEQREAQSESESQSIPVPVQEDTPQNSEPLIIGSRFTFNENDPVLDDDTNGLTENISDHKSDSSSGSGAPHYSVIIPTAAAGKPLLESLLIRLEEIVNPEKTELIIVDNASIDDTFDYLEQLKEKDFLQLRTITNRENRGFGASVNRGIDIASGKYIVVMHNDVLPGENLFEELRKAFEMNANLGIAAPVLNKSAIPGQVAQENETALQLAVTSIDSCCFMIQNDSGLRFDEEYGLYNFEMEDFCKQVQQLGLEFSVSTRAFCEHREGQTASMIGINMLPFLKWANREYFHKKWGEPKEYNIPSQGSHPDRLKKLGVPANPLNPDVEWIDLLQKYLTSEVKTEILRSSWSEDDLISIVTALLIADERELLRTLEDRIDNLKLPVTLLLLFIEYYFSKNIFSRCRHYLEKGGGSHPAFDLYRLKILVADKETNKATPLLTSLLDKYPCSPDLMRLAGDIYRQNGDQDEAKSFYALANQLDPYRFSPEETEFEINS